MLPDYSNQFYKPKSKTRLNFALSLAISLFLVIILPSFKEIKLYTNPSNPSNYEAYLNKYLNIFTKYGDPQSLPQIYEEDLKIAAQNALNLVSESKVYYPNNQRLLILTAKVENQINSKFPELIANTN